MLPEFENHHPQEQVCVYERQIAGQMEFAGNGEVSRKSMYESESQTKQAWDDEKTLLQRAQEPEATLPNLSWSRLPGGGRPRNVWSRSTELGRHHGTTWHPASQTSALSVTVMCF